MSNNKNLSTVNNDTVSPIDRFIGYMETYERNILPDLLSEFKIPPAKFKQIVISELKKNSKLIEAFIQNPISMFASILAGAEIGLIPSELLGHFFLIPRNIKQADGKYKLTVCPQIGYKGIIEILQRSGDITRIHTEIVYEGDEFEEISGLEPTILHVKKSNTRTADKITHVYAVAKNKFGEKEFTVLTRQEILAIQSLSPYNNDLYFNDKKDPMRWMERKTAIFQLAKMLPKDYYATKAIEIDNRITGGAILSLQNEIESKNNQILILETENNNIKKNNSAFKDITSLMNNTEENEQ